MANNIDLACGTLFAWTVFECVSECRHNGKMPVRLFANYCCSKPKWTFWMCNVQNLSSVGISMCIAIVRRFSTMLTKWQQSARFGSWWINNQTAYLMIRPTIIKRKHSKCLHLLLVGRSFVCFIFRLRSNALHLLISRRNFLHLLKHTPSIRMCFFVDEPVCCLFEALVSHANTLKRSHNIFQQNSVLNEILR